MSKDPLGADMWIAGTRWGVLLTVLFFLGTLVVFGVLALLGVGTALGIIAAMVLGPILGTLVFIPLWKRRPQPPSSPR